MFPFFYKPLKSKRIPTGIDQKGINQYSKRFVRKKHIKQKKIAFQDQQKESNEDEKLTMTADKGNMDVVVEVTREDQRKAAKEEEKKTGKDEKTKESEASSKVKS